MNKSRFHAINILCLFFFAASAHASVDAERLKAAISGTQSALLEQRTSDGCWQTAPEANTLYTSLQILLYYYLGRQDQDPIRQEINGLRRYLLNTQAKDGSWLFFDKGYPDTGLTVVNYFALKLSGSAEQDPALQLSRKFIIQHGGADAICDMYKLMLFPFDQYHMLSLPRVRPQALICIAPQLSWMRMILIPLLVVLQENAIYHPPEQAYINELFINNSNGKSIAADSNIVPILRQAVVEAELASVETNEIGSTSGYRLFHHWLLARQNTSDGLFYDYMPTTFCALMSLKALEGRFDSSAAIDRALAGVRSMQVSRSDGIYQAPADDAIASTATAILGLLTSGLVLEDQAVKAGIDFLWSRQQTRFGDWLLQLNFPVLPGGWGFTYNSESFPDTDDTAIVLLTLQSAYGGNWRTHWWDFTRSVLWLLAMQNYDGGWGTWDRSSLLTKSMKKAVPPLVFNESVVDHTTRVLNALSLFGYTASNSLRIAHAVNWLKSQQLEDGSWEGTWFVDYLYQTANVLGALSLVKAEFPDSSVEKSLNYILEKQNADGGWGESPDSFSFKHYVPLGRSSPSQTALVLFGLLNFLNGNGFHCIDKLRVPVNDAIAYLLATQEPGGRWNDPTYIAVVFPQIQYVRYPVFQEAIILTVLGLYNQHAESFAEN